MWLFIRLSSHNLEIETGRNNNVLLNNKICKICERDLDDEFHCVLVCPHFEYIRKKKYQKVLHAKANWGLVFFINVVIKIVKCI